MKKTILALLTACATVAYAEHDHEHDHECEHEHEHAHEQHEHHEHEHREQEHDHEHERGVEVSDAAARLLGLTTVAAERRVLEANVSVPARVVENPKALQTLSARLRGFVTYTAAAPQTVADGARLFEFVSPEAAAKYGELRALSARLSALASAGAKNAQLATELTIARIAYDALTNGLVVVSAEEGRFAQTVPCAGRVVGFDVASGSFVEQGAALARLRAETMPSVLARVPVGDATELADGLAASVAGETGSLILDRTRNDGLVDVWFVYAPEAKPSVRLGESVSLEIRTAATGEAVTAVPSAAIFRDGLQPTVMVRDDEDEDRFVTQAVTPGASANGWTEVKELAVGTEVVVQGLYELRQALPQAGAAKRVAGHFHADGKFHAGGHDDEE